MQTAFVVMMMISCFLAMVVTVAATVGQYQANSGHKVVMCPKAIEL